MNDVASNPVNPAPAPAEPKSFRVRWIWVVAALMALVLLVSLALSWSAGQRVRKLEQELVRRQQDSQTVSTEARLLAKRADDTARESAAKVSLLEAKLAEVAIQRTQLEDLIQSLSRSRDENVLVDIDAGLRVAQQQSTITGSAEPLVAALRQADERLSRYNQPRLEGVRRAIARDIDRVRAVGVPDVGVLSTKLDEAIRLVDELPMLAQAESPRVASVRPAASAASAAPAASAPARSAGSWHVALTSAWDSVANVIWGETKTLVRVTRIDQPEAMLLAPEQAFFLRENLKLRLLNARLALLSRQFDTVQSDLKSAQAALERYFDRSSRRTGVASDLIRQVSSSARQVGLPRPEDTLAALAAANGGR